MARPPRPRAPPEAAVGRGFSGGAHCRREELGSVSRGSLGGPRRGSYRRERNGAGPRARCASLSCGTCTRDSAQTLAAGGAAGVGRGQSVFSLGGTPLVRVRLPSPSLVGLWASKLADWTTVRANQLSEGHVEAPPKLVPVNGQ